MTMTKTRTAAQSRFNLKKTRVQLEKLEDRVMLSAEPLVQLKTMGAPLVADNVLFDLLSRGTESSAYDLAKLAVANTTTVLNLKKGAEQDSNLLVWEGEDQSLMKLSRQVNQLVLDLGDGADDVHLSTTADGLLKISGDSIYDLVFAAPTQLVGLRGGSGVDKVLLDNLQLGTSSLVVEAEDIHLPEGKTLQGQGDFVLRGYANLLQSTRSNLSLDVQASVQIDGTISTSGSVMLQALSDAQVRTQVSGQSVSLSLDSTAQAVVGAKAVVNAASLGVQAYTQHVLQAGADQVLGSVSMTVKQATRAEVDAGATLVLGSAPGAPAMSLLVEAIDRSRFEALLHADDAAVSMSDMANNLGRARVSLDIARDVQARLEGQAITQTDPATQAQTEALSFLGASGLVQVSAVSADHDSGGTRAEVVSSLLGQVQLQVRLALQLI